MKLFALKTSSSIVPRFQKIRHEGERKTKDGRRSYNGNALWALARPPAHKNPTGCVLTAQAHEERNVKSGDVHFEDGYNNKRQTQRTPKRRDGERTTKRIPTEKPRISVAPGAALVPPSPSGCPLSKGPQREPHEHLVPPDNLPIKRLVPHFV